ncbi:MULTISPECIES: SMI1/KNR4 family protein [unclassified Streptomyces]|uniref:SMI1/KNR4 family protein n=1 Tax=unclassified Streptomyces TaxID=2593676 RepID=UPI002E285C39|nr:MULTISPECIES: SMI1/KNR4 family protein [unclassified Streptomyces]WSX10349.1 SMI1/KNR4 family protein [Streptomyces sp. NBC_00988]
MNNDQASADELAALRAAFGVDDGGESALGWDAVRAFEAEHGVVLPEPYRTFVAEMSDGSFQGPPEYGLVGLAELPDDWGDGKEDRDPGKPFPLAAGWLWEEDDGPYEDPDAVVEQVLNHGSIVLGTDGCAMNWHLVVTGPQRGHVWHITDVGAMPFGAEFGFTTSAPGFAGWVAHWAAGKEWFDAE